MCNNNRIIPTGTTTETENSAVAEVIPDELQAEMPEQTTRALAQGKEPILDGIPLEEPKAIIE